jgi:hypothetical protein
LEGGNDLANLKQKHEGAITNKTRGTLKIEVHFLKAMHITAQSKPER